MSANQPWATDRPAAPAAVRLGEEREGGGKLAKGLAILAGEGLAAGALEGGGDVVPGGWKRGAEQAGEDPPHQGQRGRVGASLPAYWDDVTAALKGTGREPLTGRDRQVLGQLAAAFPLFA